MTDKSMDKYGQILQGLDLALLHLANFKRKIFFTTFVGSSLTLDFHFALVCYHSIARQICHARSQNGGFSFLKGLFRCMVLFQGVFLMARTVLC